MTDDVVMLPCSKCGGGLKPHGLTKGTAPRRYCMSCPIEVTEPQAKILDYIQGAQKPLTVREIAGFLYGASDGPAMGTTRALLSRLSNKSLVRRVAQERVSNFHGPMYERTPDTRWSCPTYLSDEEVDDLIEHDYEEALLDGEGWAEESYEARHGE